MPAATAKERDDARFMLLDGAAKSEVAQRVVFALSLGLVHRRRKRPTAGYQATMAAILCDFVRAAEGPPGRWSYRSLRPSAFTGQRIGYRPFLTVISEMEEMGMVELLRGHQQWNQEGIAGSGNVPSWSRATRLRPTDWLTRYMTEADLTPHNWHEHFNLIEPEMPVVKEPLVLRRRTVRHRGERYQGYSMRVDLADPKARQLKEQMDRLNRFFAQHVITPTPLQGFRRIFNNGESPTFQWNQGGRLYAVGGGYQTMRKADRRGIKIDGEPVAEIDVRASFISILSAKRGMPLDPLCDPYDVDGLPRALVKAVVTMTLGHDRFHTRWPSKVKRDLEEELGVRLGRAYPLPKVLPLIVQKLPALADWGNTDVSCYDLQFTESEALLLAVERLAYQSDVPTLPIHDSLVVPLASVGLAQIVLADAFEEVTGHRPQLKVS